jgi:hypothetical protein
MGSAPDSTVSKNGLDEKCGANGWVITPATMTHDYKGHGSTTLFAALSVLDGTVIGRCMQRRSHLEFIRFLNAVERERPKVFLKNSARKGSPSRAGMIAFKPYPTEGLLPQSGTELPQRGGG